MPPALTAAPAQAGEHAQDTPIPNINGKAIRQWPRDKWLEAMWECPTLTPNERTVGHVFARYAGKTDIAWCLWDELIKRTGIKSRTTISKVICKLVTGGWMREDQPARQHFSARYQLTIPQGGGGDQTSTDWMSERARRTRSGRLKAREQAPDVQEMDVPDVQGLTPDVQSVDPREQTEHSDLQPGGTLPPDPLRHDDPKAGRRTEQDQLLTLVVDSNDTKQVTSKTARARNQLPLLSALPDHTAPECETCGMLLDPDGLCAQCRKRSQAWADMTPAIHRLTRTGATA